MRRLISAADGHDALAAIGLLLIGGGLWFVSVAAALAVPGALLFLMAVPLASLYRRGGG